MFSQHLHALKVIKTENGNHKMKQNKEKKNFDINRQLGGWSYNYLRNSSSVSSATSVCCCVLFVCPPYNISTMEETSCQIPSGFLCMELLAAHQLVVRKQQQRKQNNSNTFPKFTQNLRIISTVSLLRAERVMVSLPLKKPRGAFKSQNCSPNSVCVVHFELSMLPACINDLTVNVRCT